MSYDFLCLKEITSPDWSFVNSTIQALFSFQLIRDKIFEFQCGCDSCLACSLQSLLSSYVAGLDSQSEVTTEDFLKKFRLASSLSEPNCHIFFLNLINFLQSKGVDLGFQGQIKVTWTCENQDFFGTFYDLKNSCKLDMKTVLKPFNPQLLLDKSNENFLSTKNLYHNITDFAKVHIRKPSQCSEPECFAEKITKRIEVLSTPENFAIRVIWENDPGPLEILQSLITIKSKIDLQDIIGYENTGVYVFKGLIASCQGKFLYMTVNAEKNVVRIEDQSWKTMAGGRWIDAVFNFANNVIRPEVIFYEKGNLEYFTPVSFDKLTALEVKICEKAGFFDKWDCRYCLNKNPPGVMICDRCDKKHVLYVGDWNCECGHYNWSKSLYCEMCYGERFGWSRYEGVCDKCGKSTKTKMCIPCNSFKCLSMRCDKIIYKTQKMAHFFCGQICDGFCSNCNVNLGSNSALCFICKDDMEFCPSCNRSHPVFVNCNKILKLNCPICKEVQQKLKCSFCNTVSEDSYCLNCKIEISYNGLCENCATLKDILRNN